MHFLEQLHFAKDEEDSYPDSINESRRSQSDLLVVPNIPFALRTIAAGPPSKYSTPDKEISETGH